MGIENKILERVLLQVEQTEKVMDIFEQHFSIIDDFRVMLFPIEASLSMSQGVLLQNFLRRGRTKQRTNT